MCWRRCKTCAHATQGERASQPARASAEGSHRQGGRSGRYNLLPPPSTRCCGTPTRGAQQRATKNSGREGCPWPFVDIRTLSLACPRRTQMRTSTQTNQRASLRANQRACQRVSLLRGGGHPSAPALLNPRGVLTVHGQRSSQGTGRASPRCRTGMHGQGPPSWASVVPARRKSARTRALGPGGPRR